MKRSLLIILLLPFWILTNAQNTGYITEQNINYYSDSENRADEYIAERCVLDLYHPENVEGFSTVVWFHGGGLTSGNKSIPWELKEKGMAAMVHPNTIRKKLIRFSLMVACHSSCLSS